jgi:transcriptional regulator with XRE-family HTH domain
VEAHAETSPFVAARLRRRLSLEEAAARAELDVSAVKSLEECRTYVFPSTAAAIAAALVYGSSLGITPREARELAGLPSETVVERWSLRRWLVVAGFVAALASLLFFALRPEVFPSHSAAPAATPRPAQSASVPLPPRWEIQVDVFNGTRKGNAAAQVANEVAGLAYRIGDVGNANRVDYRETRVYYPPGAEEIAARLAGELGVGVQALPGGKDQSRLIVIVGAKP